MTDESQTQTYHLRVLFSNYEKSYLGEHLVVYLRKIQRHLPHSEISQDNTSLNTNHSLIQFESSAESTINAYEIFTLQVNLCHAFNPSELFFTAKFLNVDQFSQSYALTNSQQIIDPDQSTMLSLNTPTGKLQVASHYPVHQQKMKIINSLTLNIHLEQLQYSMAPYNIWQQVETSGGHLYFPSQPGILHSFPPLQNETINIFPHLPRNVGFHRPIYQDDIQQQKVQHHRPFTRFSPSQNNFGNRQFQHHPDPLSEVQTFPPVHRPPPPSRSSQFQHPDPISEYQTHSPMRGPPPTTRTQFQQLDPLSDFQTFSHTNRPPPTTIQTGVAFPDPNLPPFPSDGLPPANNQPPSNAAVGASNHQSLGATSISPEKTMLSQQYRNNQLENIINIQQGQRARELGTKPRRDQIPRSNLPSNNPTLRPTVPDPNLNSLQQRLHTPAQDFATRSPFYRGQTPHQGQPPQPRRQNLHQTSLQPSLVTNSNLPPDLSRFNLNPVSPTGQPPPPVQSDQHPQSPHPSNQHAGVESVQSNPELIVSPQSGQSLGIYNLNNDFLDWSFEQEEEEISLEINKPDQSVARSNLTVSDNVHREATSLPSLLVPDDPPDMIQDRTGLNRRKQKSKHIDVLTYGATTPPTPPTNNVTVSAHSSSKNQLDLLSTSLKNFPRTNLFSEFSFLDPTNPDQMFYSLPPYLDPYVQSLLSRMNDHLPPSLLAVQLQPFLTLDPASEKYISINRNLNLIILQKLDFLLSKEKQPTIIAKASSLLNSLKKRSSSK